MLSKKKKKIQLGVGEEKLAVAIQEATGIKCQKNKKITEIIRGIRQHLHKFINLNDGDNEKAQLGLGHSYSRSKVKFNVNKVDNMVIQSISLLDQLEKDLNTFCMRVREWYSWHFPELYRIVPDNYKFARLVRLIGSRYKLKEDKLQEITEITEDDGLSQQIFEAASSSMGQEISEVDLINISVFANKVIELSEYKQKLQTYLKKKVGDIAPNLTSLIGELVAARLISHAGSLTSLAKYPASTVQILGAEKALFRALKTRGNTPKYGLIYHSSFIGKAPTKHKGRISRYLANKCSLASRIDCFTENSTTKFGELFKEQVEERLKFYENGTIPRKNSDVISQVVTEVNKDNENMDTKGDTPASGKKKKRKSETKETPKEGSSKKKRKSKGGQEETPKSEKTPKTPKTEKTPKSEKSEKTPKSSKSEKKKTPKSEKSEKTEKTPKSESGSGKKKKKSKK